MIFKKIKKHVLQGGSSNRTSSIPPLSELSKDYVVCCKFPLAQKFPHLADHQNFLGTLNIYFTPSLSLSLTHKHTNIQKRDYSWPPKNSTPEVLLTLASVVSEAYSRGIHVLSQSICL